MCEMNLCLKDELDLVEVMVKMVFYPESRQTYDHIKYKVGWVNLSFKSSTFRNELFKKRRIVKSTDYIQVIPKDLNTSNHMKIVMNIEMYEIFEDGIKW